MSERNYLRMLPKIEHQDETLEQHETKLTVDRESKKRRRVEKLLEQHETRLVAEI